MRSIAELPHPACKITLFGMNGKYVIKLEKGPYEQTFKIPEEAVNRDVNDVFKLLDEEFIQSAAKRFDEMHHDFHSAFSRYEQE